MPWYPKTNPEHAIANYIRVFQIDITCTGCECASNFHDVDFLASSLFKVFGLRYILWPVLRNIHLAENPGIL